MARFTVYRIVRCEVSLNFYCYWLTYILNWLSSWKRVSPGLCPNSLERTMYTWLSWRVTDYHEWTRKPEKKEGWSLIWFLDIAKHRSAVIGRLVCVPSCSCFHLRLLPFFSSAGRRHGSWKEDGHGCIIRRIEEVLKNIIAKYNHRCIVVNFGGQFGRGREDSKTWIIARAIFFML